MIKRLLHDLVVGFATIAGVAMLAHLTAGEAAAQAPPPTHQAILDAISDVQSTADAIDAEVDAIEAKLDSGPTRISACTTITSSGAYVVTQNLTTAGTCLVVQADFVTLDLGGFTLTGGGTLGTSGITDNVLARQGIVVRNGTVTNFADGIFLSQSGGSVVERVRAIGNAGNGIFIGAGSTVTGNTASGNGGNGIIAGADSTVTGNTANRNGLAGITAAVSTITGNTANANSGSGIAGTFSMTISNNTASVNTGLGIFFFACAPTNVSTLIGNTAQGNNGGVPNPNTSSTAGCVTANNAF